MEDWSGKESYEGYFKKVQLNMINRFSAGLEKLEAAGVDIANRLGFCVWAVDNIPELLGEEHKLIEQLGNMWYAGEVATSFDDKHFHKYEVVVREWGSVTNKIFNRYFKALEVSGEQQKMPDQMALNGLSQEGSQMGVEF